MKKSFRMITKLLLLLIMFYDAKAQQHPPFYNEIQEFKKQDSISFPPKNAILFIGSSSFQKWHDVQAYFPHETIINRGFGGSQLTDAINYANDIIIPYHPKQIVIYSGENDLAYSDTVSAKTVFNRVVTLFNIIRSSMPKEPIIYISIKPSPSRKNLMAKMEEVNRLIKFFLMTKEQAVFIDVYHLMLDKDGNPLPGIYVEDNLHMNAAGYHIWQKVIEPYLLK
jgi:lysophospholipase L1-like esterase